MEIFNFSSSAKKHQVFGALKGAVKLHSCSLDVFAEQNGGRRVSRTWVWCQGEMGADGRKMGLCSYIDCYVLWVCYGHAIGVNWCAMGKLWVYCGYCLGSSGTEKSHLSVKSDLALVGFALHPCSQLKKPSVSLLLVSGCCFLGRNSGRIY